jgi:hypothetical protein
MPTPTVPKSPQTKAPGSHCFVLIHSTGQGATGWDRLVAALAERGSTAHAVELPSDPDLPAAGYAELIRRQVGAVAAPIVLAHSGSGPLLPAAARALHARRQVWLAAWVPRPDATFAEEVDADAEAAFNPDWIGKDRSMMTASQRRSSTTTATSRRWSGPCRHAGSSCRARSIASGSHWRKRSRRRSSSPATTARSGQSGSGRWRASAWEWNRSRSRPGIARTCRCPTAWRRSSSRSLRTRSVSACSGLSHLLTCSPRGRSSAMLATT